MSDIPALLQRFAPTLCYDSQEAFFADAAEMVCDGLGCALRAGGSASGGERVLAGGDDPPALALEFLRPGTYSSGDPVAAEDRVCLGRHDYRSAYVALRRARPELCNRIYGRACPDGHGRLWLQYWFCYVYNDYHLAANFGLHEGDWEMIQIRLDEDASRPELACFAQHEYAEVRNWVDVVTADDRPDTPVVFVGRGSHASYFAPGLYGTAAWFDIAEGDGFAPELALEIVDESASRWTLWPGVWGATRARSKLESNSPAAPCTHEQWADPEALVAKAEHRPEGAVLQDAQNADAALSARRLGRRLLVRCVPSADADDPPDRLVVTVNSSEESTMPPRTFTFSVGGRGSASFVAEGVVLDPHKRYDVDLSVTTANGVPSRSLRVTLTPGAPAIRANVAGELTLIGTWIRTRVLGLLHRSSRSPPQ